jgi:metal transporter CNNM
MSDSAPTSVGDDIIKYSAIIVLVCFSAMFSGLTLGLLSLDKIGLKIVMSGEDKDLAAHAARIAPIRANGNLLLCTLLLGNVAVNAYLSILMAELTSGTMGFILSTVLIVLFGEIIPQATCSRYALQIGARAVPIVKLLMLLLYPFCWPLSWVLDKVLGDELGTIHSKTELTELLRIHVQHGAMDIEQGQISEGAITYVDKKVSDVMSAFDTSFMIGASELLNFNTITEIFRSGYSRIPVYEKDRHDVVGILLVKDLIFVDPDDATPVRHFIQIFGRNFHLLWPDDKLGDVLRLFKTGKSHMAIVRDVNNTGPGDPFYEMLGIVTLEDIIEEILQDEIKDETDGDGLGGTNENFDYSKLRLLDSGKLEYEKLTRQEAQAIGAHFMSNISPFSTMSPSFEHSRSNTAPSSPRGNQPTAMPAPPTTSTVREQGGEWKQQGSGVLVIGMDLDSTLQSPAPGSLEMGKLSRENTAAAAALEEAQRPPTLMECLLDSCPVVDQKRSAASGDSEPNEEDWFYKKGQEADFMIMVLMGKVAVTAGKDNFRSEAGPWSVLGADSLDIKVGDGEGPRTPGGKAAGAGDIVDKPYVPDFNAYISSPEIRYIRITREDYRKALQGSFVWKAAAVNPYKGAVFKDTAIDDLISDTAVPTLALPNKRRSRNDSSMGLDDSQHSAHSKHSTSTASTLAAQHAQPTTAFQPANMPPPVPKAHSKDAAAKETAKKYVDSLKKSGKPTVAAGMGSEDEERESETGALLGSKL